ncbi:MAG: SEC-C domain-containing protein [Polyangiaceae bacterium]
MGRIVRNDPCPCGSRRKYKKCCGATEQRLCSAEERNTALLRVLACVDREDYKDATARFWGDHLESVRGLDGQLIEMATVVFEFWLCFDEGADADDESAAEFVLASANVPPNERRYLTSVQKSAFLLYEVIEVAPGIGMKLRDLMGGREVSVRERSGSRSLHVWDVVAARVVEPGASGFNEIDGGILPIRKHRVEEALRELRDLRESLSPRAFREQAVLLLVDAWVRPEPTPRFTNYDGHELLPTRVHFDVVDRNAVVSALDRSADVARTGEGDNWSWIGVGTDRKESVSRGVVGFVGDKLRVEVNSKARGEAARAWLAELAGASLVYRATEHEDLGVAVERVSAEGGPAQGLPAELVGPAQEAMMQYLQDHYERWLDEPVPMFDDRTPRAAARDPAWRGRVAASIEELEGMYERALLDARTAPFDPTWMWEELGLEDLARGRSGRSDTPRLAHEVIADLEPDVADAAADIGDRARRTSSDPDHRALHPSDVEADIAFHKLLRDASADPGADGVADVRLERASLTAWVTALASWELHLRKTFWVEEDLAWMLGATALDVTGDALRPPFTSFALVFTDRYALGLAERLIAADPSARLRGRMLRALTVYVASREAEGGREMRVVFAGDSGDTGRPDLIVCDLLLPNDADARGILATLSQERVPSSGEGDDVETLAAASPRRALVTLVLNAILYATSADADAVPGDPRGADAPPPRRRRSGAEPPAGGVFRLPGKIDITALRKLKRIRRDASDVRALRRCMVRGHWRRAGKSWKDGSPRWIKPYWRGPAEAPIVEREYRLK